MSRKSIGSFLWDLWCIVSIIGIWPRFIEPALLRGKKLKILSKKVKSPIKIAFFSDLHWNRSQSSAMLNKLVKKTDDFDPDYLFLGGDFLCEAELFDKEKLTNYLCRFKAKKGCFAILGNHDYDKPLSINENGDYDVTSKGAPLNKIITRLFKSTRLTGKTTERAQNLKPHPELLNLLKMTPFECLNNQTQETDEINIVGLGEYMASQANPEKAYQGYNPEKEGVVLVHNPDMIPHMLSYPGCLFLSGHTHGGQVNLPWIWRRLTAMEDSRFKSGEVQLQEKMAFVSRGVGSLIPFRWFASPEVVFVEISPDV